MSVWISDEKLLIFASLISPSKKILFPNFRRCNIIVNLWGTNFHASSQLYLGIFCVP